MMLGRGVIVGAPTVLSLDDRKLLAPGVHDAAEKEVERLFGRFRRSDRRAKLFRKLRDYLKALRQAEIAVSVIIDGSFVMACVDEPEDIDLILVLPKDWDMNAELKSYQYELVSKRRVRRAFGFDAFSAVDGTRELENCISFFSQVNWKWR
jgi:hypothetical protein